MRRALCAAVCLCLLTAGCAAKTYADLPAAELMERMNGQFAPPGSIEFTVKEIADIYGVDEQWIADAAARAPFDLTDQGALAIIRLADRKNAKQAVTSCRERAPVVRSFGAYIVAIDDEQSKEMLAAFELLITPPTG